MRQPTFPGPLEKEPYNEHLQPSHANHQSTFHNAEIKDPSLRTLHGAKIPVLSCAEVFLVSIDGR